MSRKTYVEFQREERRLSILQLLERAQAYRATVSVLYAQLDAMGDPATRIEVRADADWLAEQKLVALDEPAPGALLVTLTEQGHDVAQGKSIVEGIKRAGLR